MEPNLPEQTNTSAPAKTPVLCPLCGANVIETGVVVITTHRQVYTPGANGFSKSRQAKSYQITAHCLLCGAVVTTDVEPLIGKKA